MEKIAAIINKETGLTGEALEKMVYICCAALAETVGAKEAEKHFKNLI